MLTLILPIALALWYLRRHDKNLSTLVTLSCAAITVLWGKTGNMRLLVTAGLVVSAFGDRLMNRKKGRPLVYAAAIGCFAAGHLLFAAYTLPCFRLSALPVAAALALTAGYLPFLKRSILPHAQQVMRLHVIGYTLVSVLSLVLAIGAAGLPGQLLYVLGIASIVFSDTIIALQDFGGRRGLGKLIMPTYFLCHILVTASMLAP